MRDDWSRRPDGDLLRSKDAEAFREFYVRYERLVVTVIAARVRNAEMTADLTAETFAAALLAAPRFRDDDGAPAAGWILGIARNITHRFFERQSIDTRARARLGIERAELSDESLERVEALIDASDPDNPVLSLLEELPASQREAVKAHVLEEQSYAEIAAASGVTQDVARQRVSRGLRFLRFALKEGPR